MSEQEERLRELEKLNARLKADGFQRPKLPLYQWFESSSGFLFILFSDKYPDVLQQQIIEHGRELEEGLRNQMLNS